MAWVTVGLAAAGAISGKMKNDRAKQIEASDRQLAADTQRYSPWTHLQAQPIRSAGSTFGDVFGGGVNGAMTGQNLKSAFSGYGGNASLDPQAQPTGLLGVPTQTLDSGYGAQYGQPFKK